MHIFVSTVDNGCPVLLTVVDGNEAAYAALEQGRQAMEHCSPTKMEDAALKASTLHKWPYQGSEGSPLTRLHILHYSGS